MFHDTAIPNDSPPVKCETKTYTEGYFEYSSHGFRPDKSCHTALTHIQNSFSGTKWFIEGDIKGFFDNINHEVLINTLKERITDERFIRLIRKFLNAGYVENWKFHNTYSGTPQGGIVSPILANIYLDKFDKYMNEYAESFNKGVKRHRSTEARRFEKKKRCLTLKLKEETDDNIRKQLIKAIREVEKERTQYPHGDEMDANWRRLKYVRYADDFLIGVIGNKSECVQIKANIAQYMSDKLKLELSEEKTLITNAQKPAKFLGYDIFVRKTNDTKKDMFGNPVRMFNNKIVLYVTTEVMKKKLMDYDAIEFNYSSGKEVWKSKANNSPIIDSFYDIIPSTITCKSPSLIQRLKDKTCELCGVKEDTMMFQVRNLKALKGKNEWEPIPSPKAELFKLWIVQVAKERLDQMQDPELSIEQAMPDYF